MTDKFNDAITPDDMEEFDNIVTLTDDEGNDVQFEFLDLVEYQDGEYVVLMPLDDDSGEVLILQIVQEGDDEEVYAGIDDDETLAAVFGVFKEKYKDILPFAD